MHVRCTFRNTFRMILNVLYCITLLLASYASGSVIEFQSYPISTVTNGLADAVKLRCSLNDTATSASIVGRRDVTMTTGNVQQVSSIVISMNGLDVASVSTNHPAQTLGKAAANLKVIGNISKATGERGYLEINMTRPTSVQREGYLCEVTALGSAGHDVIFNKSLEIVIAQPTIDDLVNEINNGKLKDQKLQTLTDAQHNIITSQQSQIASLQSNFTNQNNQISSLQTSLTTQNNQISSLQSSLTTQNNQISSLQSSLTNQNNQISSLQSSLTNQNNQISSLQSSFTTEKNHAASLQNTVSALQINIGKLETLVYTMTHQDNDQVRLLGGNGYSTGAVQVTHSGLTGMICDDKFGDDNNGANVVCKMLGYSRGYYHDGNSYTDMTHIGYILDDLDCDGDESSLSSCGGSAWGDEDCGDDELAGVSCY